MPAKARRAVTKASAEDVAYCRESLLAVSRSFARPIEMLPGDLRTAVTCGYLLCRIADTIEDNPFFAVDERDERYATFLAALEASPDDAVVRRFEDQFRGIEGNAVENDLCQHLGTVMRVFRTLPKGMQTKTTRWVAEMTRGMQLYSHRAPGDDGYTALFTPEDLERYCYFVAGTVGHMLTDLFVEAMGAAGSDTEHALRSQAEAFGVGLQFVNILKDVTDDRERRVSFIPRTTVHAQGLSIDQLVDPSVRDRAHAAVAPLFDTAQNRLDRALDYVLAIPAEQAAVRLFCLLPLWMAVRTLVHARGNDAMFTAGDPVKIARGEVESLIADCVAHVGKDDALRQKYDALWRMPALVSTAELTVH
jgi:farnesyl-diphosphate farnesyltransferase